LNTPNTDILTNHGEFANIGCGPAAALDQMEATGWSSNNPEFPGAQNTAKPIMTVRLPQAVNVVSIGMDPGNTCMDGTTSGTDAATVFLSTNTTCGTGGTLARQETFVPADDFGVLQEFPPVAGGANARCVRLQLDSSFGSPASTRFRDFSEFGVYSTTKPTQPTDPVPAPLPTPTPPPSATPVPTATPTPTPAPAPAVTFKLPTSGTKGSAVLTVTCLAQCTATATLTADKKTAKKLKLTTLGTAAKAGKGSLKFTVKLSTKARKALKRRHLKSVTVTLKVSVRLNGKTTTSSKRVKIKL
jgi:hypothetical protein